MGHQVSPHTVTSLSADLLALGVLTGDVLLLHASRRSVGFVAGGSQAIVQAFLDVLGSSGTLVVPTHTPETRIRPPGGTRPCMNPGGQSYGNSLPGSIRG
jgi:aminoglycoside N3'-acetyltransferase